MLYLYTEIATFLPVDQLVLAPLRIELLHVKWPMSLWKDRARDYIYESRFILNLRMLMHYVKLH